MPRAINSLSKGVVGTQHNMSLITDILEYAHLSRAGRVQRDPTQTKAYLVGGGIGSLAAAAILIRDAHVPAGNIHIIDEGKVVGGAMDGSGAPEAGYIARGGRMLNCSYVCLYNLLKSVPSADNEGKTLYDDIMDFTKAHPSHAKARLVEGEGKKVDVTHMGFTNQGTSTSSAKRHLAYRPHIDRLELLNLWVSSEEALGTKKIEECFSEHFFTTNFWFMWITTFAFQPWHSAVEFKRYLHRFIHEFPRINTLEGVDRTPLNQYDSIIAPLQSWLQKQGVNFLMETKVVDVEFDVDANKKVTATRIHTLSQGHGTSIIEVRPEDLTFVTNGSMTSASSLGSLTSAPQTITDPKVDGAWSLWSSIAFRLGEKFAGNPANFINRVDESKWESFTVTTHDPLLQNLLVDWSGNEPGSGALVTFKDSNWLLSYVLPHQPHFRGQPEGVSVFWGYGLYVDKPGNFVKKPMSECTGAEILQELLYHVGLADQFDTILPTVQVIPAMLPYITSQFLTREHKDRPKVVPKGSHNFAWLGQWTEIPDDTVFTVEYSVRSAMIAVYELMGLPSNPHPPAIYKGEHHLDVIFRALNMSLT
ncbi:hypothetical protein EYR40_001941 [Pleurotus pulmonarius]|nr:hypothetical protein EYR40_001941 [Pleurotus pulmonarius]